MSRMLSLSVLVLISISIIGCGKSDDGAVDTKEPDKEQTAKAEPVETKIIGKWKIDVDRSVEMMKTSPKVKPADYEKLPKMVQRRADMMQMEITESEMKMIMGTRSQAMGYKVDSTDADAQTVTISINEAEGVTVVCKIIDGTYLNQVSSGTDDMNFFVWEPVKETPAE
jgi:hypothetical protein